MAKIPLSFSSGGGSSSSEVTASSAQVLKGYTAITTDSNDEPKEGTIPLLDARTLFATISNQIISGGQYLDGDQVIKALTQSNLSAGNIKKDVNIKVNNGNTDLWNVTGTYSTPSSGQSPVTADKMLEGYSAFVNGGSEIKGTISTQSGKNCYVSTSDQTIVANGKYCSGNIVVKGVSQSGLTSANILRGKTITISNGQSNIFSASGNSSVLKMVSGVVNTGATVSGDNGYIQIAPGITPIYGFCWNYNWITDLTIYINGTHYRYGLGANSSSSTNKYYNTISYTNTSSATRLYFRSASSSSYKIPYFLFGY